MNALRSIQTLFLACCLCCILSCKKDTGGPRNPANPTIMEWIAQQPDMKLLSAAIQRTHLDTAFASGGPWTFFAPDDSAFIGAGLTLDVINQYDPAALSGILGYHLAPGVISGSVLYNFFTDSLVTLNPTYKPTVIKNYYGIFLNGIKVIDANIPAADGVIQVIGRVALPPVGNILAAVRAQPDLTYTAAFLQNTTTASQLLLNNPVTFFAPSDSAWQAYGFTTLSQFNLADTNTIYSLLNLCIDQGPYFTATFLGGGFAIYGVGMYGSWHGVMSADGLHILATTNNPGNLTPPAITHPDIVAANGVLDIINQVYFNGQ